jgi:hypothetical protein
MNTRRFHISLAVLSVLVTSAIAEKKWQGQMPHRPILGQGLSGAKVILNPISGRCSKEFGDLLRKDLIAHDISVLSESDIKAAGGQARIAISFPITGASEELGKLLGPTDVISIDITQCQALPLQPMLGSGVPATHISRTEAHFLARLRVTDLSSGAELVTQNSQG